MFCNELCVVYAEFIEVLNVTAAITESPAFSSHHIIFIGVHEFQRELAIAHSLCSFVL